MTKDDIDKLWNQAMRDAIKNGENFTRHRFANLVAAAEREACLDAMMQSTTKAVDTAMALEREACAKVAEQFEPDEKTSYVMYASKAIRARGNT
jgi:hypothetical protein